MKIISKKGNLAMNVLTEKCPHCGQGHVFKKSAKLFEMPVMNEECEVCHYKFDREPGYFLGAMYVSYAIAVFFGIVTYLTCAAFFPNWPLGYYPLVMMLVILGIAKKNYKLSRVIYIHMFPW